MSENQKDNGRRTAHYVLIVAFIAAIWTPMAGMFSGLAPRPSQSENRRMASFPEFGPRWNAMRMFFFELKPYLKDNFGFRPVLIHAYHILKGHLLGVSSSPQVVLGKEGWLFYAGEQAIESYRCVKPYTSDELDRMQHLLEEERDWLAQRGIHYLVVIVPNNPTLNPEYLPDWLTRVSPESRLDQLICRMDAASTLKILDLRPALLQAKRHRRVSCRTDTHWNEYGAFIGYQAIMEKVSAWFPNARPLKLEDFDVVTQTRDGGDLARMIDAQNQRREETFEFVPHAPRQAVLRVAQTEERVKGQLAQAPGMIVGEVHQPGLPRAVMFRDSSAIALMPFLSEHFSRIAYVGDKRFHRTIIESEKPDVVIREFTERFLMHNVANFSERAEISQTDEMP
jgi:alginate O-acetyltransferase complex protein AlgJ